MFKRLKEFLFGKPKTEVSEAPYKIETPVVEPAPVETTEVVTKVRKPRAPRQPKVESETPVVKKPRATKSKKV